VVRNDRGGSGRRFEMAEMKGDLFFATDYHGWNADISAQGREPLRDVGGVYEYTV